MGTREKQRCERKILALHHFEIVVSGGIGASNNTGRNTPYRNSRTNCNQLTRWFPHVPVQCSEIALSGMINAVDNLSIHINPGPKNRRGE